MSNNQLAKQVLNICEVGSYRFEEKVISIKSALRESLEGTVLYTPERQEKLRETLAEGGSFEISVIDGTTQTVAKELSADGEVCLLNFASARNPGGGFLNGAKAQEEDLCRCSSLYPTIEKQQEYYEANRKQESLLYTDYLIYSPDVAFFKTKGSGEFLPQPFLASVITSPAPNTRPYLKKGGNKQQLEDCFQRRWENVLVVAADQGAKTLVLGAWGCGAFGGDPEMAAATALNAIDRYGKPFHRIVFAIPGRGKVSQKNLDVFRSKISA